jgi:hypothetical protein
MNVRFRRQKIREFRRRVLEGIQKAGIFGDIAAAVGLAPKSRLHRMLYLAGRSPQEKFGYLCFLRRRLKTTP